MSSLLDYLSTNRPLKIHTALPPGTLLAADFQAVEAISSLYRFDVRLLAPRPLTIEFDKMLGQQVAVELEAISGVSRYFHGLVCAFAEGNSDDHFTHYSAVIVPKFWLWTKQRHSRVFQRQSVPEILHTVLDGLDLKLQLTAKHQPREYCVQWQESDFAFASRLMEEEGIYYFFEHAQDGHTLVLADSHLQLQDVPDPSVIKFEQSNGGVIEEPRVTSWSKTQSICTSEFTLWDYNFQMPDDHLEAQQQLLQQVTAGTVTHQLKSWDGTLEQYEYPGAYARHFDGVNSSGGDESSELSNIFQENQQFALWRMQAEASAAMRIEGVGNCGNFLPGHHFQLLWHGTGDGKYLLTRVEHSAQLDLGYRSDDSQGEFKYQNNFVCLPAEMPYRPPRVTPRPILAGLQTAKVVGPSSDQVFVDKYGRVKVQFHWDRQGHFDANSSCWVRVAQFWAGNRWGAFFWPRIGQEVVVVFEEGNPDRPLIVGSVYNADNMPPFELPKYLNLTGIRSCTLAGSGTQNYNTIVFDDTSDDEHLSLHSENFVHVSSEQSHYNIVPSTQFHMIGSLPFSSGSGGGPPESESAGWQKKNTADPLAAQLGMDRDEALRHLISPELYQKVKSLRPRGKRKKRGGRPQPASWQQLVDSLATAPAAGRAEEALRHLMKAELLRGAPESGLLHSGQGGGLWDFPAAAGLGDKDVEEFLESEMPSSFQMVCGDATSVGLRETMFRYWSLYFTLSADIEDIIVSGLLGTLEVSPLVEGIVAGVLGMGGNAMTVAGSNHSAIYGETLNVQRGKSYAVDQQAFWQTNVASLSVEDTATAKSLAIAVRVMLGVLVLGSLICDILIRVLSVPDASTGATSANTTLLFVYNGVFSRMNAVMMVLEKEFAELQKLGNETAAAAAKAQEATDLLTRADTSATTIAADAAADAERRLTQTIQTLQATLDQTGETANQAASHDRVIAGNYSLAAAGDIRIKSSLDDGASSITIVAEGAGGTDETLGTSGTLNLTGTQAVNVGTGGGSGGVRITGTPDAVATVTADAGLTGTAKVFAGVPDVGPRLALTPATATMLNGVTDVGASITLQVAELKIACGVPGQGASITLTPESITLAVGENTLTLTAAGLTQEVMQVESAVDSSFIQESIAVQEQVDGAMETDVSMLTVT